MQALLPEWFQWSKSNSQRVKTAAARAKTAPAVHAPEHYRCSNPFFGGGQRRISQTSNIYCHVALLQHHSHIRHETKKRTRLFFWSLKLPVCLQICGADWPLAYFIPPGRKSSQSPSAWVSGALPDTRGPRGPLTHSWMSLFELGTWPHLFFLKPILPANISELLALCFLSCNKTPTWIRISCFYSKHIWISKQMCFRGTGIR